LEARRKVIAATGGFVMARKYARSASKDVEREMRKFKRGTARSGKGGKGGKVKSRKQAIAIGLSEARRKGKRVPPKSGSRSSSRSRRSSGSSKRRSSGS
jgi:Family of unknown function (DUF6496)